MAREGMEIKENAKKGILLSIRSAYKYACNHPFVSGVLVFLFLLYRACPFLFAFLVSSSPVIICTALLLGVLLNYGEPNIPDIDNECKRVHEVSSTREANVLDNIPEKHLEEFSREERSTTAHGNAYRQVPFGEEEEEEKDQTLLDTRPLIKLANEDVYVRERATNLDASLERVTVDEDEDVVASLEDVGHVPISAWTENDGLKMNDDASIADNEPIFDKHDDALEYESDRSESSSPDASMADIIPMLDELHPLLPSDDVLPTHEESDDGSADEAEHNEDEDDEEGNEGKDDGAEAVVSWTAVDQKNLMDLGTSELERNRRLENLIAKRRAKKDLRFDTERNLIDFESNDTTPILEHLSHLLVQIPRFSAQRRNPFDLPCDSEEAEDLPPIPGSAPSVLLPRANPFDFTYDERVESISVGGEGLNRQDHVTAPQHDMVFRRHESFAVGESSSGHFRERFNARLKPYFVAERMDSEEIGSPGYERQSSEISETKASSMHESDSISSVNDQEHRELIEEDLHQDDEHPSQSHLIFEPQLENRSSFEVNSVAADRQMHVGVLADVIGVCSRNADVIEEIHRVPDSFGDISEGIEFTEPMSGSSNLEVIEEPYDDLSSSSSSDESERMEKKAESVNEASFHEQSHLPITVIRDDDSQLSDPIYDSSPSALEKSLSISTSVDEVLFDAGKAGPGTDSSRLVEKNINGRASDSLQGDGGAWMGISNLRAVDENELKSRGISEINEDDVIGRGFFGLHANADYPLQAVTPISSSRGVAPSYATMPDDLVFADSVKDDENNINALDLPPIPEEKLNFKSEEAEKTYGDNEVNEMHVILEENAEAARECDSNLADLNAYLGKNDEARGESEIQENNEIYENLLSELDVVGDFSVANQVSDQSGRNKDHADGSSENIAVYKPHFGRPLVANVSLPPNEDPELTIYNSKHHVLDACSVQEIDAVYKQHLQDASGSSLFTNKAEDSFQNPEILDDIQVKDSDISSEKLSSSQKHSEDRFQEDSNVGSHEENSVQDEVNNSDFDTYSDVLEFEVKSTEDNNLVFKKVRKASITSSMISEVGSSDSLPDRMEMDLKGMGLIETPSDLQVIEARSLEDIDLFFNQLSKDAGDDPSEMELRTEDGGNERQVELVTDDGSGTEFSKNNEDIDSGFQSTSKGTSVESFHSEVGPSEGQQNPRPVETPKHDIYLEAVEADSLEDTHADSRKMYVHEILENQATEYQTEVKRGGTQSGPDHTEPGSSEKQSSRDP